MSVALLSRSDIEEIIEDTTRKVIAELRGELSRPPKEIMTKAELAEYWNCSTATINRYMNAGMPVLRFGENDHPRFRRKEVDSWRVGFQTIPWKTANV
jgi:hypothetical protein